MGVRLVSTEAYSNRTLYNLAAFVLPVLSFAMPWSMVQDRFHFIDHIIRLVPLRLVDKLPNLDGPRGGVANTL